MQVSGIICRRTIFSLALMFLASGLVSCSGGKSGLNPVKGKVLYKDAPFAGILVTLHPAAGDDPKFQVPTGVTKEDGSFEIETGPDLGAPAGDYVVTMIWMQEKTGFKKKAPGTMSMVSEVPMEDKLKGKYADPKNPAFKNIKVSAGPNEFGTMNLQ